MVFMLQKHVMKLFYHYTIIYLLYLNDDNSQFLVIKPKVVIIIVSVQSYRLMLGNSLQLNLLLTSLVICTNKWTEMPIYIIQRVNDRCLHVQVTMLTTAYVHWPLEHWPQARQSEEFKCCRGWPVFTEAIATTYI